MLRTNPADADWFRALTRNAQHLYMLLERSEGLSHAGVLAWWPGRIASWAQGWTEQEVREAFQELQDAGLVAIATDTSELLLTRRIDDGYARHSPKLRTALARAIAKIGSPALRLAVTAVVQALFTADPVGWGHPEVAAILAVDGAVDKPVGMAEGPGAGYPIDRVSDTASHTLPPADSRAPFKDMKEKTKRIFGKDSRKPIKPGYAPSSLLKSWAARECPDIDIDTATRAFVAHNIKHGKVWSDADSAWQGWMVEAARLRRGRRVPAARRHPVLASVTPIPPPVGDRLAMLGRWEDQASPEVRARWRTGWRELASQPA
jgi:hypothetical protein